MGRLYLVGTPIGNLEDITLRALRVLKEARLIAAEDTRHCARLLNHFDIKTPMISYHQHSRPERVDEILATLTDGDVAVVSDAGMPGVSDPGFELVCRAIESGVLIESVPGPSAVTTAAAMSGL
ncbi:MAG TPA: SAM-dependent methyltransferase, partial [Thermomicrobiaceae bacterium]|nr:SAM-dependent methyltransferase [Thermomicrobiaceae bacterium]